MKAALFTNEFPPYIYGGAGVHVDYLSKALAKLIEVEVRAFGDQNQQSGTLRAIGFPGWDLLKNSDQPFAKVLQTLAVNLAFNNQSLQADIVHCHTWYTFFAGFLAKSLYSIPLIVTMHSLEPLRPWKEEQLATGYALSSWIERTGVLAADRIVAVSEEMKQDILKYYQVPAERVVVIHNGVDLEQYQPIADRSYLDQKGITQPYLLFVGRISRQKGIFQLLDAMAQLQDVNVKLVLCASAPDTPGLEAELRAQVGANPQIIWINEMVPKPQVIQLYSHASIFVCPSVYEPFGIINLEAMACQAPVVASRVGGIKEVVVDGETGLLVPPDHPRELAAAIRRLLNETGLREQFRAQGRKRVEQLFSWQAIARRTVTLYEAVLKTSASEGLLKV